MTASGVALVPPLAGRTFATKRLVRLGDVLPSGHIRLDAIARYLQDIAADDGRDAGIDNHMAWLVRRTTIDLARRPRLEEPLDLVTWASGSGARWAERRTTIFVGGDPVVEAASLWVCVDLATMRPARLSERFWTMYGDAVGDRIVSSRLSHPDQPIDPPPHVRPWPLRVADLDVLGHVNNAGTWTAVEDELDRVGRGRDVLRAEVEYRGPIDRTQETTLASEVRDGLMRVWLASEGAVRATAAVTLRLGDPPLATYS
jgi:acyl-ACP thioesterase